MNVNIISKSDVKKIVKEEVTKLEPKVYRDFNRLFSLLRIRMIRLEKRIDFLESKLKKKRGYYLSN